MIRSDDPRYGWVMVFTTFTLTALAFGALASVSVFLKPLAADFGWTRSETSFGYTTVAFSSALCGIFWGYLADRVGGRWFGLIGAVSMSACLFLMSRQASLVEFYALYFVYGALGMSTVSAPLYASVGFWFKRRPGFALGITAAGGAIGQGIVPFFVSLAISAYGWQTAYVLMAAVYLAIALPVSFLVREAPDRRSARIAGADVPPKEFPLSDKEVMIWIGVAVIFCCNCMAAPIVHLVPLLTDQGHAPSVAASVLLVLMIAGGFGRVMGGKLCDVIGALPAYMIMALGQSVFVYWFPHLAGLSSFYLLAVVFGFTYSGVMSSILVSTRIMVSPGFAGRAMAITSFFGWLGMGMGGFLGGVHYDATGDYVRTYSYASVMGATNVLILIAFYLRTKRSGLRAGTSPAEIPVR
ncbi:MAG: MFS transporter [Gammaproteobacteria bacterium]|nr:MFS transporter [Gammaproteobacteria bacterium]